MGKVAKAAAYPFNRYYHALEFLAVGIITSRGCPFKCTFCARITGNKLRFKTIDQVIEEIKYLQETFKIKQFHFYDDTITCKKSYITELCQRFIDENLNLHWSCFARVDTICCGEVNVAEVLSPKYHVQLAIGAWQVLDSVRRGRFSVLSCRWASPCRSRMSAESAC